MNKTIKITEELSTYIQSLDYEYRTRKELIAFMLTTNMDISSDAFVKYNQEMIKYAIEFDKAKQKLEQEYIIPVIKNKNTQWSLDYFSNIITLEDFEQQV